MKEEVKHLTRLLQSAQADNEKLVQDNTQLRETVDSQKLEIELLRARISQLESEQLENAIQKSAAIIESVGSPPRLAYTPSSGRFYPMVDDPRTRTEPSLSSSPPSSPIQKDKSRSRSNTISAFIRATSPPIKINKSKSPKNSMSDMLAQYSPPTLRKEPSKTNLNNSTLPSPSTSPMIMRSPSKATISPATSPKLTSREPSSTQMSFQAEPLKSTPHQPSELSSALTASSLPSPKLLPTPPQSPKSPFISRNSLVPPNPPESNPPSETPKSPPISQKNAVPQRLDYPKPPSFRIDPATLPPPKSPAMFTPYTLYESRPTRLQLNDSGQSGSSLHIDPVVRDFFANKVARERALNVEGSMSRPLIDMNRANPVHLESRVEPVKPLPKRPESTRVDPNCPDITENRAPLSRNNTPEKKAEEMRKKSHSRGPSLDTGEPIRLSTVRPPSPPQVPLSPPTHPSPSLFLSPSDAISMSRTSSREPQQAPPPPSNTAPPVSRTISQEAAPRVMPGMSLSSDNLIGKPNRESPIQKLKRRPRSHSTNHTKNSTIRTSFKKNYSDIQRKKSLRGRSASTGSFPQGIIEAESASKVPLTPQSPISLPASPVVYEPDSPEMPALFTVPLMDRHTFVKKHTKKLTWCFYCSEFIWGFFSKQVYCCTACKYTIHQKCYDKAITTSKCGEY